MKWKKVMITIVFLVLVLILIGGIYAYKNLKYDYDNSQFLAKYGEKLGFDEKQVQTKEGLTLNYGEGPNNGPALLLLHGQMVSWENYAKVLPELSKHFHIFALDYYGHGGSSKVISKYNAVDIGNDIVWFIKEIITEPTLISGHSSGALLTAWVASKLPEMVKGIVLEDGPFFSTEPDRIEKTFSGQEFKMIHNFLNQEDESIYLRYYLNNTKLRHIFNKDGKDNWEKIVKNPALKLLDKNPNRTPIIWYYPHSLGVNTLLALTKNLQDGTGEYDLHFADKFYDNSWFKEYDQKEVLEKIVCPTIILHVAPPKDTAPSYYDEEGILMSAMDKNDAIKVSELINDSELIEGFQSMHNIHDDFPEDFIRVIMELNEKVD
ncbi:MAG: alpha/beta hydrolase [Tissierellia bacterium]|nr:alpha/beta hydrolase [Tissierellia bacterium]